MVQWVNCNLGSDPQKLHKAGCDNAHTCNPSNADGRCRQGILEACGTDTQCALWREEPLSTTVWKTRPNTQDYPLPFTCIPRHAHSLHPWTHALKHMKINNLILSIMGRDDARSSVPLMSEELCGLADRPWQFGLSWFQVYKRTDLEPKLTSDFQLFESPCTLFLQRVSSWHVCYTEVFLQRVSSWCICSTEVLL